MMNHDIFISYSSKQKSIADGVCHYLEENGFKCWMAPRDIPVGSEYGDLIEEAIKTSKVVVLVFSEAASISKWVKGEINVAFSNNKPILPFRIDETQATGALNVMLNQMHWIDAYPRYSERLPDLLKSVSGFLRGESNDNNHLLKDLVFNVKGVSFVMKPIKGADFWMGAHRTYIRTGIFSRIPDTSIPNFDKDANEDESPVHKVTLASFFIGETAVTQDLWRAVMGSKNVSNENYGQEDGCPVANVSWNNCKDFIDRLNRITNENFRLPTEAEWEYAARGGVDTMQYRFSGGNDLYEVGWFHENSGGAFSYSYTQNRVNPVKQKKGNALGLYDMSGNVWEWCQDWYGGYGNNPQVNPSGPKSGDSKVLRGGGWNTREWNCRVSQRHFDKPNNLPWDLYPDYGFRLALSLL